MSEVPVITIDGPTASGKGTIAQRVADALRFNYLDSGALYRLVAWRALQDAVSADDADRLSAVAAAVAPRFAGGRISMDGQDVTAAIRTEEISQFASRIAGFSGVRNALLGLQRSQRRPPGLVADGRDMGTVIFPDAQIKIFLTASAETRANRRYKQLKDKGESVNLSRLFREVEARDLRDSSREVAPLKPAGDAIILDSTDLNIDEVVQSVFELIEKSGLTD